MSELEKRRGHPYIVQGGAAGDAQIQIWDVEGMRFSEPGHSQVR
jgi:hypothetical protein